MQNGFNHRKIIAIVSLFTAIILLLFSSCRTSKKAIEKSKIEIQKSELKINKVDSSIVVQKNNTLNKVDSLSWSNYMKYFDLSYSGLDPNDYLEFTKTANGFKLSGKGNVNIKSSENKGDSIKTSNNHQISNEQSKINSNSKVENSSVQNLSKIDKKKDKFSLSPTFGVLVGLIIIGLLIVYLVYRYLKNKR